MSGKELKNFAKEIYNLFPIENVHVDEFVRALVKCGVIGFLGDSRDAGVDADPGSRLSIYRKAKFEYVIQGNLPVSDRFFYCVHPVMGDAFNMEPHRDGLVIYPLPDEQEGTWLEEVAGIVRRT